MDIKIELDNLIKPIKEILLKIDPTYSQIISSHTQQLVLSVIEYVLLGSCCPCTLTSLEFKSVIIQYVQQLRKYYQHNRESTACQVLIMINQIVSKLIKIRQDHAENEKEGFMDSEEEETKLIKQVSFGQKLEYTNDPALSQYQDVLKGKDLEISSLKIRLQLKEQKLLDLATGYLKDLQNMREQMYKKSDDFDYYEVQYCDVTDIEDQRYRDLVNNKLANLKSQYEKKTREIYIFLQKQKTEIHGLRQTMNQMEQKIKIMDSLEYLMNRLFSLEPDPYRIWKYIQDIKGNYYFKDVFEKQKPASGINYREINQLLMVTKAYDRELEYYKKGIEDQMIVFLERACGIINLQNQDQLDEIEELKKENLRLIEYEKRILQKVQEEFAEYKLTLKQHQNEYLETKYKEHTQLQRVQAKYAMRVWGLMNKMQKNEDVKEMILYAYQNEYEKLTQNQFAELENNYLRSLIQTKSKTEQNVELQNQINQLNNQLDELQSTNHDLKVQIEDLKALSKNHQKVVQQAFKHIDSKINPQQLNLDDNNRETTKSFKERLKQLKQQHNGLKFIAEVQEQYEKNQLALELLATNQESKATQTNIMDVSKSLLEAQEVSEKQKHAQQNNDIHVQVENKRRMNSETQTEFIDVEDLQKQIKDLKQQIKYLSQDLQEIEGEAVINQQFQLKVQRNQSFDQTSSQRSATLKRRYAQVNESKDSSQNFQDDFFNQNNSNMGNSNQLNFDQMNQLIIMNPEKSIEKIALTQLVNTQKNQQKGVFNRLFEDSKKKSERIQQIKRNLENLEREHWQQIVELVKEDQEAAIMFKESITSSKHFYQQQLKRNLEFEQRYFPQKHNRAQFYFKKFKDFHVHQNEGDIILDPTSSEEKASEAFRLNIKSVVEDRKLQGKVKFNGLKREEYQFFKSLERKKLESRTFRSTQQSPQQRKVHQISFTKPFLGSQTSYDMGEYNNKQITKHLQKAYDLG